MLAISTGRVITHPKRGVLPIFIKRYIDRNKVIVKNFIENGVSQVAKNDKISFYIIYIAVIYILAMLLLSYLIDIRNIFGLSDWLYIEGFDPPLFWLQIFKEASLTEYLQWFLIGSSAILAALYGGMKLKLTTKFPWTWILLVIGLALMFLEDTINLRHQASNIIGYYYFGLDVTTMAWRTSALRSYIEIIIFAALGSIMVMALIFILKDRSNGLVGKKILFAGYFFYGVAAICSATRNIGNWYAVIGEKILNFLTRGVELSWSGESIMFHRDPLGFWFMDLVVEESIELLGAAFILAAIVAFITHTRRSANIYP